MAGDLVFEWDDGKAAENIAANRPPFDHAECFEFGTALRWEDRRRDYGETRMIAIGLVNGRHPVLVYTDRGERVRVISFRKANDREIARYDRHSKVVD